MSKLINKIALAATAITTLAATAPAHASICTVTLDDGTTKEFLAAEDDKWMLEKLDLPNGLKLALYSGKGTSVVRAIVAKDEIAYAKSTADSTLLMLGVRYGGAFYDVSCEFADE